MNTFYKGISVTGIHLLDWSLIRRKKNCDTNFVLRYDTCIYSLCIAIYRYIVTPLVVIDIKLKNKTEK